MTSIAARISPMMAPVMTPDRGVVLASPQLGVGESSSLEARRRLACPQSQPRPPPATAPITNHNAAINPSCSLNITQPRPPGCDFYLKLMRTPVDML